MLNIKIHEDWTFDYVINDVIINYVIYCVIDDDVKISFENENVLIWLKVVGIGTIRLNLIGYKEPTNGISFELFLVYSKFSKSGVVSLGDKLFRGAGVGAVPAGPIRGVGEIFVGGFDVGTGGAFRSTFAISAKLSSLALENKINF